MPHALGPEKSVLSSMMKNPGLLAEHPLDPEIFYLPGHQTIYRFMTSGPEFELVSFIQRLHDDGKLDGVGGPAAVTDIWTYAPNPAHFDLHLAILRKKHARRMTIRACCAAVEAAYDESDGEDSDNFLQALSGPVTAVFDTAAAIKPPRDIKAIAREFIENLEKRIRGEPIKAGIPTGIPEIDRWMRGLHPQHFGIISARSGGGKSTLATQIGANVALAGHGVLYLILERTETSAFERSVIQTSGLPCGLICETESFTKMREEGMTKEEIAEIRLATTRLVECGFHIRKPPNRKLATQLAEIRRYVRLHKVKVVFVDQIGLVKGSRQKGDSEEVEKRSVSNTLQELAHELGITVVVMSQITDDGDTKGARAIEEDADWHLQIIQERDRKAENFGEHQHILFAKHSHNAEANGERLPLILNHATLRFVYGYPKPKEEKKKAKTGRSNFA